MCWIHVLFAFKSGASPGSKTAQIIEALHGDDGLPDGLVVANDAEQNRCYTLVHQAKRLQSPCLVVTNQDAKDFPRIMCHDNPRQALQFDRILCDVPCSGDGTLRKNPMIWGKWKSSDGNGLHKLQKQILRRSFEQLKVGGRLVYSTCSFNPIENEAVVASILEEAEGAIRLIDVSNELPGLIRHPGVTSWKVSTRIGEIHTEFNETNEKFLKSMFPPACVATLGMEKCMRIYPFDQNTGGFFVAVLEKVAAFGSIDKSNDRYSNSETNAYDCTELIIETEPEKVEETITRAPKKAKTSNYQGHKEDPFIFLPSNDPFLLECANSVGLAESFPKHNFAIRSASVEGCNSIYLLSEKAKSVIGCVRLKIINAGIKVFKRNVGTNFSLCPFRLCSEGFCAF